LWNTKGHTIYLDQTFKVKDRRDLKCFLRLQAARSQKKFIFVKKDMHWIFLLKSKIFSFRLEAAKSHKRIHIFKKRYALDILTETWLLASKPTVTHMIKDLKCFFKTEVESYDINS